MTRVAVILSGCGFLDGAEIHESVLTLLALDRAEAKVTCAAPNVEQMHTVDHKKGAPSSDKRNVLVESARIARGNVVDLATLKAADFDAVVLPGGYGAAKNVSTFAAGKDPWTVNKDVERFLVAMKQQNKMIGAICIAPVIVAQLFGKDGISVTIGDDPATAKRVETTGAKHLKCGVDQICVDQDHRIVSTPAYMLAKSVAEAAVGIEKLVRGVMR